MCKMNNNVWVPVLYKALYTSMRQTRQDNALVADKWENIYWIDGVFFYEMKKRGQILEIYGKQ